MDVKFYQVLSVSGESTGLMFIRFIESIDRIIYRHIPDFLKVINHFREFRKAQPLADKH